MSLCKVLLSVLVLGLAIFVGLLVHYGRPPPEGVHLDTTTAYDLTSTLSYDQLASFERDGVLVIRDLLDRHQVEQINTAIEHSYRTTSLLDVIKAIKGTKEASYKDILFDVWRVDATVANLALKSFPKFVAPLLTPVHEKIRLLRDAYFNYETGGIGCGWHVDDAGFWPTEQDTGGVTLWIALDDIPNGAGGLAIANQTTLSSNQLEECRKSIVVHGTCGMAESHPECHALLERHRIDYGSLQAGDAIIWDRWVFHRTQTQSKDVTSSIASRRRYSVRYIPGNARGRGAVHHSVRQGESFEGSPYYPQVWPNLIPKEMDALAKGLASDMTPLNVFTVLSGIAYDKVVEAIFGTENQESVDRDQQPVES